VGESREQRQPLEDGVVTISHAAGAPTFPHTVERYAELKGYLAARCPYMSEQDRALILGGNLQRVFDLS
jgi:hypothetical protein